jgi:sorting nexin-17
MTQIVEFPPKIFRISDAELEQRKKFLERYIHCLTQDRTIGNSDLLQDFMLAIQHASCGQVDASVELEVFLCNQKSKKISCSSFDRTSHVLEAACKSIGISADLVYYFALFVEYSLLTEDNWKNLNVLTDFQSPCLTLFASNCSSEYKFRIAIKRWFFHLSYVTACLIDPTAVNMLYIEAISDLDGGRVTISDEMKTKISTLKKNGKKKELIQLLSDETTFGYKYIDGITINDQTTQGIIGGTEFRASIDGQEKTFSITKLRCWKVGVFVSYNNIRTITIIMIMALTPQK